MTEQVLHYTNLFDRAVKESGKGNQDEAEKLYTEIINGESMFYFRFGSDGSQPFLVTKKNETIIKKKEESIYGLAKIYASKG